jgi:DNA polymerase V
MAMELQGISCVSLADDHEPKKSILSSRSFGDMQMAWEPISQAVSAHCATVYEKLRKQGSFAQQLTVFLRTNRFREDLPQHQPAVGVRFISPTDDLRVFTAQAMICLKACYRPGFQYKKAGVWLDEISSNTKRQCDFFHEEDEGTLKKTQAFLSVFDKINQRYGKDTLRLATEGFDNAWNPRLDFSSPAYTTRWGDLPKIKNGT